ncbi:MAG: ABC transporter permease subunit [Clostridiales Family XIII bacterium]|jgi:NitT/TauT family transport system permease protein|nr:ABC transporter permease subunit [Clostridiales Family XIII bacterium]
MSDNKALAIIVSVIGFLIALALNLFVPDKQDVIQKAYRFILIALSVLYLALGIRALISRDYAKKYIFKSKFIFAMGIVLAVWDLFSSKLDILEMPFFPSPGKVCMVFIDEYEFLLQNVYYSLRLFTVGFLSGIILGIGTGILIGWFARVKYWVFPVLKITGIIPAVAWMPFALTIFPTSFVAGAFLIAICAWFPVAFMTAQGMATTQQVYFDVAKTLGGSTWYQLFRVALPNAFPNIFTGISTASGLAFTTLIVSEMMGAQGGLGYYINWSKAWSAYYKIYAAIVIMAILFSLILKVVSLIQGRVLRWQKGLLYE